MIELKARIEAYRNAIHDERKVCAEAQSRVEDMALQITEIERCMGMVEADPAKAKEDLAAAVKSADEQLDVLERRRAASAELIRMERVKHEQLVREIEFMVHKLTTFGLAMNAADERLQNQEVKP